MVLDWVAYLLLAWVVLAFIVWAFIYGAVRKERRLHIPWRNDWYRQDEEERFWEGRND